MTDSLVPGQPVTLAPGIRRLVAPNPGLMTGPGTNTYLLGETRVAVIDPGPALDEHIDAIIEAAGAPIGWILATHTHSDHSPASERLASETGAEVIGLPAPQGKHQHQGFSPARQPADGDLLTLGSVELEALHTPGHASNHLCFLHRQSGWLFTGDHIINGSTVVIDPPDGDMGDYLRSLERLASLEFAVIAGGHGAPIVEPRAAVDALIAHRLKREAKVAAVLAGMPGSRLGELVTRAYDDVDASLHAVAERSLLAHLLKLQEDAMVRRDGDRWSANDQPR